MADLLASRTGERVMVGQNAEFRPHLFAVDAEGRVLRYTNQWTARSYIDTAISACCAVAGVPVVSMVATDRHDSYQAWICLASLLATRRQWMFGLGSLALSGSGVTSWTVGLVAAAYLAVVPTVLRWSARRVLPGLRDRPSAPPVRQGATDPPPPADLASVLDRAEDLLDRARNERTPAPRHVDRRSAVPPYSAALDALAELGWLGVDRAGAEYLLLHFSTLGTDATACALAAGAAARAAEMSEQGRATLWSRTLSLGSDTSGIARHDPDLARELDRVRAEIRRGAY